MKTIKVRENPNIVNNCLRYEHLDGYPWPAIAGSCRGCRYNYIPEAMDGGCKHPDGFLPRKEKHNATIS